MFEEGRESEYYSEMLLRWVQNGAMELFEIEELVYRGANVNAEEFCIFVLEKQSVIIHAIITNIKNHGKHNKIVSFLLSKGAKIDMRKLNLGLKFTRNLGYTVEVDEFRKRLKK